MPRPGGTADWRGRGQSGARGAAAARRAGRAAGRGWGRGSGLRRRRPPGQSPRTCPSRRTDRPSDGRGCSLRFPPSLPFPPGPNFGRYLGRLPVKDCAQRERMKFAPPPLPAVAFRCGGSRARLPARSPERRFPNLWNCSAPGKNK